MALGASQPQCFPSLSEFVPLIGHQHGCEHGIVCKVEEGDHELPEIGEANT